MSRLGAARRATLRSRLVAAFVISSVATLAAATLVLLPVLEHRLVSERLADLRELGRTARPVLQAIPARQLRPNTPAVREIADRLQRRTGGSVAIYDDTTPLVTTPRDSAAISNRLLRIEQGRASRIDQRVVTGRVGDTAHVVSVVADGHEQLTLIISKPLNDTRAAAAVVRAATPGALAAGLLVAMGLALLLGWELSRRLARLHADARALGAEGLQHPVQVEGGDEVAVVAAALEDLRVRLRAEEASRQAFVSTASHELRTPLASLQATLELLREEVQQGAAEPSVVLRRADTALRQTHRLSALATDLLDLSRVDGAAPLAPEPLDVSEVVDALAPAVEDRLHATGRALQVEGGPAVAVADPAALARILGVLLDNACAYGAGTVTTTVASQPERGTVTLAVTDQGPGLTGDERERVFLRFTRGQAAAGTVGSGLGLPIARGLARAMGGDVAAEPTEQGARLVVTLPAWTGEEASAVAPAAAASPAGPGSDHEARTPR